MFCCCSLVSSSVSGSLLFGLCSLVSLCSCISFVMRNGLTLQVFSKCANLSLRFCAVFLRSSYPFSFQNFKVSCRIPIFHPFSLVGHSCDVCSSLASSLQVNKSIHICAVHLALTRWILSALILQRIVFLGSLRAGGRL